MCFGVILMYYTTIMQCTCVRFCAIFQLCDRCVMYFKLCVWFSLFLFFPKQSLVLFYIIHMHSNFTICKVAVFE